MIKAEESETLRTPEQLVSEKDKSGLFKFIRTVDGEILRMNWDEIERLVKTAQQEADQFGYNRAKMEFDKFEERRSAVIDSYEAKVKHQEACINQEKVIIESWINKAAEYEAKINELEQALSDKVQEGVTAIWERDFYQNKVKELESLLADKEEWVKSRIKDSFNAIENGGCEVYPFDGFDTHQIEGMKRAYQDVLYCLPPIDTKEK